MKLLAVAAAGAAGAVARVAMGMLISRVGGWPLSTLSVNLIGCFIFGLLASLAESRLNLSPTLRIAIFGGFLGAFTTFSAFGFEGFEMLRSGLVARAAIYLLGSIALGMLAVWGGWELGSRG